MTSRRRWTPPPVRPVLPRNHVVIASSWALDGSLRELEGPLNVTPTRGLIWRYRRGAPVFVQLRYLEQVEGGPRWVGERIDNGSAFRVWQDLLLSEWRPVTVWMQGPRARKLDA